MEAAEQAKPQPRSRLTIPEAAEILNCDPQFLRIALQQGRFSEFGFAVRMKRWAYYIDKERFYAYVGRGS